MSKKNKIILLAFASKDLKRSINRLIKQANESNFYDKIKVLSSNDLPLNLSEKVNTLLSLGKTRGYGYWIWKPYLIKKIFDEMEYGDIINYMDVGCHIIKSNFLQFEEYLKFVNMDNKWILPFQYHSNFKYDHKSISFPDRKECVYTKGDLLKYFGVYNNNEVTQSPQFWAGCFFMKKHEKSIGFINEWLDVFENSFELIDDTPSKIKNFSEFLENRHDQSVYSLLCKKYKLKSFSAYECDWADLNNKRTWEHNKFSPILAKRDLKYSILKRFINRQKKTYRRLKKYFEKF
jgi:hypothetical protein